MHPLVIQFVIGLKIIYAALIIILIYIKIREYLGLDKSKTDKSNIIKAKKNCSLLYRFTMALVLINLFRPAKKPRLVKGEEKNLLYLFGLVMCLEIIVGVIKGDE